jgi:cation diffusion facilitator CzcD-associated flavoprotein CzcO
MPTKQLLIIGAGPYGLAVAGYARHLGIDFAILGKPMEFWRHCMPKGMFLRSGSTWHLDALGVNTFERFLEAKNLDPEQVNPIPVGLFVEYVDWFVEKTGLETVPSYVRRLERHDDGFEAFLDSGETMTAKNVVAAPGLNFFRNLPADLIGRLPSGRFTHSCVTVNFEPLRGMRCLIIGGRQSAFEWAALMTEAGVAEVHLAYRHDTPQFVNSDWTWVEPLMQLTVEVHGWFRKLPATERELIEKRFWSEDHLKLEPWLAPRISEPQIKLWPKRSVETCKLSPRGSLIARLTGGATLEVDHILLATGYHVNLPQVPYLSKTTILPDLKAHGGFPTLDEDFQTSVPGLFLTGLVATKDFGPFYGFVRGCPSAATIIGNSIQSQLS